MLLRIWPGPGMFIPDPNLDFLPIPNLGSRIHGSKRLWVPDPDPQLWMVAWWGAWLTSKSTAHNNLDGMSRCSWGRFRRPRPPPSSSSSWDASSTWTPTIRPTAWASPHHQPILRTPGKQHMLPLRNIPQFFPDPYWIRIQSSRWIRIRNPDPDLGG
jgi:hypothetical protein